MYLCDVIKQVINKSFSMILAFLVLLSTVSFTVEKHYCGDVLVDVAVFTEAQKCAMEAYEIEQAKITKKNCCKDIIDVVEGQDELSLKAFDDLQFEQQQFLTAFAIAYVNLFEGLPQHVIPHKQYNPPLLISDIQILDQVFLI